jgi:hypothetical protein
LVKGTSRLCIPIHLINDVIKEVIEDLKKHDFGLKIEEYLKDYLSCHIKINEEDRIAWIQKPHLINNSKKWRRNNGHAGSWDFRNALVQDCAPK